MKKRILFVLSVLAFTLSCCIMAFADEPRIDRLAVSIEDNGLGGVNVTLDNQNCTVDLVQVNEDNSIIVDITARDGYKFVYQSDLDFSFSDSYICASRKAKHMNYMHIVFVKRLDGKWVEDGTGWRYQLQDGTFVGNKGWYYIGKNQYYFSENGYILMNTTTPDGYYVDPHGIYTSSVYQQGVGVVGDNSPYSEDGTQVGAFENPSGNLGNINIFVTKDGENISVTTNTPNCTFESMEQTDSGLELCFRADNGSVFTLRKNKDVSIIGARYISAKRTNNSKVLKVYVDVE